MRTIKIFIILFLFSISLYAQNEPAPKAPAKAKTEQKYIDLDELKAMKANGATEEQINARYNEMIDAIDRDFHGAPLQKAPKPEVSTGITSPQQGGKAIKPLSI